MSTPLVSFEGFEARTEVELEAHVQAILQHRRHSPSRQDDYGYQWVVRLWKASDADARDIIAGTVGRQLVSSNVRTRSEAVRFFQSSKADDRGALLASLHDHPDLFEDVEDPIGGATSDLRGEVLRAIAREPNRSRRAIDELRAEALAAGRAGPVLVGLMQIDLEWVRANAITIVRGTTASYVTLLVNYVLLGLDVVEFVGACSVLVPSDWAREVLHERLRTRPELLRECLDALESSSTPPK